MILAFAWYRALAQCWFDLLHFGETQVPMDLKVHKYCATICGGKT